ncbi:MAG: hypothetical protein ACOZQL_42450 [Myxococcota bacterium]
MRRAAAALVLLVATGCERARLDPRLAEVTTPLHVTVRVIDRAVVKDCSGASGLDWVACRLSRAEREGCVYVETGAAADQPQAAVPEPPVEENTSSGGHPQVLVGNFSRCFTIEREGVRLLTHTPLRRAKLHVEAGGQRTLVDLGESGHVLYFREGRVFAVEQLWTTEAARTFPFGATPDWTKVPSALGVLHLVNFSVSDAELDAMLAETRDGAQVLEESLLRGLSTAAWSVEDLDRMLRRLPDAGRKHVREALLERVRLNDSPPALEWFESHPDEQRADFVEAVSEAAALDAVDPALMRLLARFAPDRVAELACHGVERAWLDGSEGFVDFSMARVSFAVLARQRLACPWVLPVLTLAQCNPALRCDPDLDDELPGPLCSEKDQRLAVERALSLDEPTDDDDGLFEEEGWGPLLLAAARAQGPLPADFALREARYTYTRHYTVPEANAELDPCRTLTEDAALWACRLPANITRSRRDDCALVVDDARKTLTLTGKLPPEGD